MAEIFISYARADRDYARRLANYLEDALERAIRAERQARALKPALLLGGLRLILRGTLVLGIDPQRLIVIANRSLVTATLSRAIAATSTRPTGFSTQWRTIAW
ncbi:MAG: hypothetical protein ACLPX9_06835 [Rhodomicrobium sp.]